MAIIRLFFVFACVYLATTNIVRADDYPIESFTSWLHNLESEALAEGISSGTVNSALESAMLDDRVIALDHKQPEQTISFDAYLEKTITKQKVEQGKALLRQNITLLNLVSKYYGVQPQIIVALWGIESSYGKISGHYNVIDSLITLAFEGRRATFFRKELLDALHILDEEKVSATSLRGSWAGAMGQCQFMPSTYLKYAVDYDGDGKKDIWTDEQDVFASIANYLSSEGWQRGDVWGEGVIITKPISADKIGLEQRYTLKDWMDMGVKPLKKTSFNSSDIEASLIQPDGQGGRSFLVYDNFRALMKWNRSTYFAATVGILADRIK